MKQVLYVFNILVFNNTYGVLDVLGLFLVTTITTMITITIMATNRSTAPPAAAPMIVMLVPSLPVEIYVDKNVSHR